jgi:hypothetical protein
MDVSSDNVKLIIGRILDRCKKEIDSAEYTLRYEVEELKGGA